MPAGTFSNVNVPRRTVAVACGTDTAARPIAIWLEHWSNRTFAVTHCNAEAQPIASSAAIHHSRRQARIVRTVGFPREAPRRLQMGGTPSAGEFSPQQNQSALFGRERSPPRSAREPASGTPGSSCPNRVPENLSEAEFRREWHLGGPD